MSIRNCDRMLKRAYGELRPEDLAHLTLRALARDDIAEADRIAGTVPLVTYRGPDLDYVRLLEEAKWAAGFVEVMAAGELGDLRAIQTVLPVIEWFLHRLGDEAAQEVFTAATRGQTGEMEDAELDALLARTHERVVGAGAALLDAMRERRRRTLTTIASVFGAFDAYVHHDLGVEPEVARRALLPPNHRPSDSQAKVEPDEKHQAVFLAVLRRETTAGELRSLDREAVLPQVDEPGAEAP